METLTGLLRYYDLGITTLPLKGFDPLADAGDFGKRIVAGPGRRSAA